MAQSGIANKERAFPFHVCAESGIKIIPGCITDKCAAVSIRHVGMVTAGSGFPEQDLYDTKTYYKI